MNYSTDDIERVVETLTLARDDYDKWRYAHPDITTAIAILKECGEKEAEIAKLRERIELLEQSILMRTHTIPMYKESPDSKRWFITEFTKEQYERSMKMLRGLVE